MNFGLDANFSEEAFVDRLNADLANDLGNLASRATTLIAAAGPVAQVTAPVEAADREIAAAAAEARAAVEQAMQDFAFQKALGGIWTFIGSVNRYVDTSAPWALAKDPAKRPRLERVLCTLADSLGFLGIVLDPFLPDAAAQDPRGARPERAAHARGRGGGAPDRGAARDQDLRPLPAHRHQGPSPRPSPQGGEGVDAPSPLRGEGRVRGPR